MGAKPPSGDAGGKAGDLLRYSSPRRATERSRSFTTCHRAPPRPRTPRRSRRCLRRSRTSPTAWPQRGSGRAGRQSVQPGAVARTCSGPWTLTWKGPPDVVPVADRVFPGQARLDVNRVVLKARIDSGVIEGMLQCLSARSSGAGASASVRSLGWGKRAMPSYMSRPGTTNRHRSRQAPSMAALADSTWQPPQTQLRRHSSFSSFSRTVRDKVARNPIALEVVADLATSLGGLGCHPAPLSPRIAAALLCPRRPFRREGTIRRAMTLAGERLWRARSGVDWRTCIWPRHRDGSCRRENCEQRLCFLDRQQSGTQLPGESGVVSKRAVRSRADETTGQPRAFIHSVRSCRIAS